MRLLLSGKAKCNSHGQDSPYFHGWQEYEKNPYDQTWNPKGIIQMGLAENHALVRFMAEIRGNKVSFDPSKIVLTAGATSANETIIFCLAEAGDAILIPTPYYPGFDRDLKWRTGADIVPIHSPMASKSLLVLITNPSNPLGTTMTRAELDLLMEFIVEKQIHLVSDEIYSGTVFSSPNYTSTMEVLSKYEKAEVWDSVHVVYSLSKDFGLPGFRVGAIYSNNDSVVATATKMSSFGLVSSQTQYFLSSLLSDKKFTKNFISESKKRLKKQHALLVSGLWNAGISCLESNAGLFCWVDMRHLLSSNTFEAEMELWQKIVYDAKLNISPGSSCHCSEPGWFRICFASMTEEALEVAIRRIKACVESVSGGRDKVLSRQRCTNMNSGKKSFSSWVFRVPIHDREAGMVLRGPDPNYRRSHHDQVEAT
ncbi:LOW QUALITY PROTEIN: hypothetical protein BT93_C0539 [Corymbia citriodora subsp. variegata]|nr:LOW QUALITY PROTEIN: hypothetical protein BT93_C0539 [Corymbia citriodora subsp. variegata]